MMVMTSLITLAQEKIRAIHYYGNNRQGLPRPSYLFGTIHMICSDDAVLSDSLKLRLKTVMRFILKWTWTICLKCWV
jgi:hypothetical protein